MRKLRSSRVAAVRNGGYPEQPRKESFFKKKLTSRRCFGWLPFWMAAFLCGRFLLLAPAVQAVVMPTLPVGITANGDGTYSGTVMKTTLNTVNFPGLFNNPIIKTVKASGGDYANLQDAFNAIGVDAPNCNEIIVVDSGYTAATLGSTGVLTFHYACPAGSWIWVRPSNYELLPPQNQTICTTGIAYASGNGQTATFTTSRDHLLQSGMTIRVKGMSNLDFNGDYVVASVPNGTTFTVANTMAQAGAYDAGGTVIPMNLYLNPSACPDIPNMFTVAKTGGSTYDQVILVADNSTGGVSSQGLIVSGMNIAISPAATIFHAISSGESVLNTNYVNHIIFDRMYMASPVGTSLVLGASLQGPYHAIVDSYIDGVKDKSGNYAETHGIWMPWAPGPYKIVDNYVGGIPTENIFTGGVGVAVTNAIPTDIELRTNTIYSDYPHRTNSLSKKNMIEFKASQRLLVDGNTLEYSWNTNTGSSQYGAVIVFNTLNQYNDATWNTNQDATITNNDLQHFGSEFLVLPGRGSVGYPTYPLDARVLLSNNIFRDWNQQNYNLNSGGNTEAGITTGPGYSDASHPASGPDNLTLIHNGLYGSPAGKTFLALFGNAFSSTGGCPGSPTYTVSPFPNFTFHANITVVDQEFLGDCLNNFDSFNSVPGLFVNLNWSGNVHVRNGVSGQSVFNSTDFTTAGPDNQFPDGGSSGVTPAGMFNTYPACISVPAGPLTSCALQSGSGYTNTAYCDNADCGPNISAIEAAQVRNNDNDGRIVPTTPGNPTTSITGGVFTPEVFPNPWRSDKHSGKQITFGQLIIGGTIKIFTTSGHKVKEMSVTGTSMPWNLDNDKGDKVASGIYVYLITDGQGNKAKGKVAVIK